MEEEQCGDAPEKQQEQETPAPAGEVATAEQKGMKVMMAVDESEGSLYALRWAVDHLFAATTTTTNLAQLILLHAQQPFQQYVFPAGPAVYATSAVMESVRKAQQQNTEALFTRATQLCKDKPVKIQTVAMEGDPKETICQAVEQMHPDLLVVGSRGLGTIKRAFLGSVSDYCAHHAKCPILIVKPPRVAK